MNRLVYWLFVGIAYPISYLPFSFLYGISNFLAWVLRDVLKYRQKVISSNLAAAFPKKTDQERQQILVASYTNLADIMVESIKALSASAETIIPRYRPVNLQTLDQYYADNRSIILVGGHNANWEWCTVAGASQTKYDLITLYKPIANPYLDAMIRRQRNKEGMEMISFYKTAVTFQRYEGSPKTYIFVADQSPSNFKKAIWVDNFLSQETAFVHGPETYARKYNYPVIYFEVRRVKRGYYEVEFKELTDTPATDPAGYITEQYMLALENTIQRIPNNWLWSHRRWKLNRAQAKSLS